MRNCQDLTAPTHEACNFCVAFFLTRVPQPRAFCPVLARLLSRLAFSFLSVIIASRALVA